MAISLHMAAIELDEIHTVRGSIMIKKRVIFLGEALFPRLTFKKEREIQ